MRQRQNVALSPPLADLQREGVSVVTTVAGAGIVIGRTKLCPLDRALATGRLHFLVTLVILSLCELPNSSFSRANLSTEGVVVVRGPYV